VVLSLKHRTIHGAFWAAISLLGVRLLDPLTALILAGLLAPSDFGLIAVAQLVVTTAQTFRDLGLAQALIYRTDKVEKTASTAFFLVVGWGGLLWLLVSAAATPVALFFNEPDAQPVIQALAFTLLISSFSIVPGTLLEKELEFKKKLLPEILPIGVYVFTAIGLATAGLGVWSIVWGRIGQVALTAVLMWRASGWRLEFSFDRRIAVEILDYGKHILAGSFLTMVFLYIDNAYVGKLLGIAALGFYKFAFDLANLPTQFITPIVNKVTFPSYVKLQNDRTYLSSVYLRSLRLVSMLTFPATLGLAMVSPDLLRVLYADKWSNSMLPLQILSLYALFRSIGALPGNVFLTIGKQAIIPKLQFVYASAALLLLWPATLRWGIVGASLVMTGVLAVGSCLWLGLANHYLDIPTRRFIRNLAAQAIASGLMVAWLWFMSRWLGTSALNLVVLIGSGAGVYAVGLLLVSNGEAYRDATDVAKTLLSPQPSTPSPL
jgi:O-antigen/teichoic acid export membrane protein